MYDQNGYDRGSTNILSGVKFFSGVMSRVYGWMTLALFVTAGMALITVNSPAMLNLIYGNSFVILGLIIAELGLVIGLSAGLNKMSPMTATMMFLLYAAVNGLTLSAIFFVYALGTIFQAFAATALTFGAMSLVGYTTKKDLTGMGGILMMGLIGLIIASLINAFWGNSTMDAIITYIGVFLFVGLTAYDTQKIKQMSEYVGMEGDSAVMSKIAIMGALSLYLDFINLFLYILRLFGRSRD